MKKTALNVALLTLSLVLTMIAAIPATSYAHHVGDKDIPGQDFQCSEDADNWLEYHAHMSAPWNTAETDSVFPNEKTDKNKRALHLETLDMKNTNADLHDTGEQFLHNEETLGEDNSWPAFTGRWIATDGGQQTSSKPE